MQAYKLRKANSNFLCSPVTKSHCTFEESNKTAEAVCNEEELLNQRQDEIFAIEAMYDQKLKIIALENGSNAQLLTFEITDALRLRIFLPSISKYPFELPRLALTSNCDKTSTALACCMWRSTTELCTLYGRSNAVRYIRCD